MSEPQNPKPSEPIHQLSQSQSQSQHKPSIEGIKNGGSFSGQKGHYPNPPDKMNPDPATLRDQWRFAIRQYSKWYSHAWGTAILAGGAFFALGWIIKGGNPLPSKDSDHLKHEGSGQNGGDR